MRLQVTFDAHDPHALAELWAAVLGYQVEDNSAFVDSLVADGSMPDEGRHPDAPAPACGWRGSSIAGSPNSAAGWWIC